MRPSRVIGFFEGKAHGPLLVCLGGIHGNEVSGIKAIETVLSLLEREAEINPGFVFRGSVLGLRGNLQAIDAGNRYQEKDLNRIWTTPHIQRIKAAPIEALQAEDLELRELIEVIEHNLAIKQPERLYLLDLHTTSAGGGIFTVATDNPESIRIGIALHAPVIKGLLAGLEGTTLHYFTDENTGIPTTGVSFESGQHDDPLSVNRAIAALINCLQIIGCIPDGTVENRYDEILRRYSEGLPKVAELVTSHRVRPGDQFRMRPGYANFQPVRQGELLAHDAGGPITAIADGLILMPLYQPQGSDGFFIVRTVEEGERVRG
jgi:succinylglutamate desuccinylase